MAANSNSVDEAFAIKVLLNFCPSHTMPSAEIPSLTMHDLEEHDGVAE